MKRILPLLAALLLSTFFTLGQELSGAWKVDYIRSMEEVYSIDSPADSVEKMESFSIVSGIVEFSDKTVKFHNFKEKPNKTRVKKGGIFKLKGEKIKIESINKDSIILRPIEDKETYIVLKPFSSEDIELSARDFENTEWQVKSELGSLSSLKFHFSDSSTLTLIYQGEEYGYANYGDWKLANSENYYVLYIADRESLKEYFFNLKSEAKGRIVAEVSVQEWSDFPKATIVTLENNGLLTLKEFQKKEYELIGKWSFSRFSNNINALHIDSILNLNFSIEFKDNGQYVSNNKITLVKNKNRIDFTNNEQGTWRLAKNGSYVIIKSNDGWEEYLSIYSLNLNNLSLDLNYRYDERARFAARIDFEKESP
ncbi:hypothetical protein QYS48_14785 [Marivirga arenosa]|uniref:Lipocalin-like domain-containing protein n=1 Tax=Marivirga arenosa TaxID=3059076 RepID=A0AA49GD91_9BACT|nr:hypothetical protein [Marivirga sp. ABR2-2]WKK83566.2 hypothetical protein QYS48_14785 [Marivirga sp. ABR2-2]